MASPGTMTKYDLVGIQESVSKIISNISPTDTPFQTMIGSEGIDNTTHQWQEDSLQAPSGTNAMVEGADAPASVQQPTVMRQNTTQIMVKKAAASGTADRVKKYGRAKELSYQLGMRSIELKRDRETTFVGVGVGQVAVAGSNTVARQMAGAQAMITAVNTVTGALTETAILSTAQTVYTNGGMPSTLMIKPADSLKLAGFKASGRTTFVDNDDKKITNVVEVYESPFGTLKVVKNRFQKATDAFVFNPSMWKILVLRNWFRETLAKTGDATNVMILGEFSLKHKNFAASGLITALT